MFDGYLSYLGIAVIGVIGFYVIAYGITIGVMWAKKKHIQSTLHITRENEQGLTFTPTLSERRKTRDLTRGITTLGIGSSSDIWEDISLSTPEPEEPKEKGQTKEMGEGL